MVTVKHAYLIEHRLEHKPFIRAGFEYPGEG